MPLPPLFQTMTTSSQANKVSLGLRANQPCENHSSMGQRIQSCFIVEIGKHLTGPITCEVLFIRIVILMHNHWASLLTSHIRCSPGLKQETLCAGTWVYFPDWGFFASLDSFLMTKKCQSLQFSLYLPPQASCKSVQIRFYGFLIFAINASRIGNAKNQD